MNSSKYTMTLDLHSSQSQYSISARLGDTNRKLLINLTDGGVPYKIPEDCSAYISIKRPNDVPFEECCTIKGNTVIEYQFGEGTCAISGIHNCDLTLYSLEGKVLGSPKFTLVVNDRAVKEDTLDTSTEPWRIIDAAALKETERQNNEKLRVQAEAERQSKDAERDSKISEALSNSSAANTNASHALDLATSAYDTSHGALNNSEQAFDNAKEALFQAENALNAAHTAKTNSIMAEANARYAMEQSDSTRTSLINLSAQVEGIGRTYVIPTFLEFIDFLKYDYEVVLREDRDGDGVDEIYRIDVNDLKSGDNIIITEKGVPDFWFERNAALSVFETYTYEGVQYSLGSIVGGVVVGGAHVLETDYTVIEGHALSAAASANEARGYAFDASMEVANAQVYAEEAATERDRAVEAKNFADASAERAVLAADRAEVAASRAEKAVENGSALFSNALKGKKSGGIVAMSDISPLGHTLNVRAVGAVKVKKLGKNLIPYPYANTTRTENGVTFTDNGDGSIIINGTPTIDTGFMMRSAANPLILNVGSYRMSLNADKQTNASVYASTASGLTISSNANNATNITESTQTTYISIIAKGGTTYDNVKVSPQLEIGTATTEYEPYIEPVEYAVNADGTVEGVTSIYPTTTLLTDTAGAVIDVEYNRDINKAFAELYNAIISLGGNV